MRATDDLDGPVSLFLELPRVLSREELPLIDDQALLMLVDVFRIPEQDRVARLQRNEHALPDGIVLDRTVFLHPRIGVGDEPRRHLANRDHLPRELRPLGDVADGAEDASRLPVLAHALLLALDGRV